MKIKFNQCEYEVVDVCYSLDECGKPVDIVVTANKDTLLSIVEFAMIGSNIQESYKVDETGEPLHEALYARLSDFKVIDANMVHYQ